MGTALRLICRGEVKSKMKIQLLFIFLLFFYILEPAVSQDSEKSKVEKEGEILDFNAIKDVIENDKLSKEVKVRKKEIKKAKVKRVDNKRRKYLVPSKEEFWSFFTEYWLVKNAQTLRWDFQKPDYGLEKTFERLLEKLGFYEKSFKILFVNTPNITHFSLPSNKNEFIFIISVPFIKQLDLNKIEIALLVLEDFIRARMNFFKDSVSTKELNKILGNDFYNKPLDVSVFNKMLKQYDDIVFKKGFSFQQQFETTKQVGALLRSDLTLWKTYDGLLVKIDSLIKSNLLYKYYNNIYPSPELQRNWLTPGSN